MATLLRGLMKMRGITEWDIARVLQTSQATVSKIVCGHRPPTVHEANLIAALLGYTPVRDLFPTISGQTPQEEEKVNARD